EDWADGAAENVGQTIMAPLEFEGQLHVVHAQAMEDGSVQIVHVDRVLDDVIAEVVGFSVGHPSFNATSGEPDGEAARMMVAAVVVLGERALRINCTPEFAAP